MKINDDIHVINFPIGSDIFGTMYLITGTVTTLIDTGFQSTLREYLLPYLIKINLPIENIKQILLTHDHPDHSGGLEEILKILKIPVYCFKKSTDQWYCDMNLNDHEMIEAGSYKWEIIHTPGHVDKIISLYDMDRKILIASDSFQARGTSGGLAIYANVDSYLNTIKKIKSYQLERMYLSHPFEPWNKTLLLFDEIYTYLDLCEQVCHEYTEVLMEILTNSPVSLSLNKINQKFRVHYNTQDSEELSSMTIEAHLDHLTRKQLIVKEIKNNKEVWRIK